LAQPTEDTPPAAPVATAGAAANDEPSSQRGEPEPPGLGDGRIGRLAFYFVWVFAVPFALAIGSVWLLTPAPGAVSPSGLRVFVAEQQIPMGIVLFTSSR
jgi:signal peptidase I